MTNKTQIYSLLMLCFVVFLLIIYSFLGSFHPTYIIPKSCEIPFTEDEAGRIFVKASINGVTGRFLIDTGSQTSFISDKFLRKIKSKGFIFRVKINLNRKFENASIFTTNTLALGDAHIYNFTIKSFNLINFNCDGVIGGDILFKMPFTIDFKSKKIFLNQKTPNKKYPCRISFKNNLVFMTFPLHIDGISNKKFDFMIDSGASFSSIDGTATGIDFSRMKSMKLSYSMIDKKGAFDCALCNLNFFIGNNEPFKQKVYIINGSLESLFPGVLGVDFLRNFHWVNFDTSKHMLSFGIDK